MPARQRFTWPRTTVAHLAPAAVTFGGALALAPVMPSLGLPHSFALTVSFALLLIPIELGLLLRAARRETGRGSLREVPAVLAYRRPLGRWWLLVPVLFVLALAVVVGWAPVGDGLADLLRGRYPGWLLPDHDVTTAGFSKAVLVTTLLITLLIDGIVNPTVEECYFRGYLLPRLPVAGWRAVSTSAAFFAVQHYWQPQNWVLIFVIQVVVTAFVVRSRSLRLGIVMHALANSFGILITLLTVLA